MGQKLTSNKNKVPKGEEVHRNRFEFQNIIGKGGFGKVWKVIDKKHKIAYALKEMSKVKVIDKKSEKSIKYERELLSHLKNPFIVNMYYAFQDYEHLYLVMDLLTGGDLRYHICKHRLFSEAQTKFFIACIIQGLEYIHSKKVIHRDIKPENLVLDENGYIRITDFGIAKIFNNKNSHETSGTPGYMAPEVMKAQNHTKAVDYFAVGVIAYELMMGKRPYSGKGRKEIKEQMMGKQACIKREEMPDFWSEDAMNFINMLLMRKPEKRLGFKSIDEIKTHPWLKTFPWKSLYDKKITSPYIPDKKENYDKKYCTAIEKEDLDVKTRYEQYRANKNYTSIFLNFTYYPMIDNWNSDYNYNSVNSNNYHVNNGVIHGNKNAGSRNANATLTTYYNRRCQSASSNAIYHNNNAKLNASNTNFRQQRVFSPKNASSLQNKGLFQGNNNNNINSNGPTKPVEPGMRKYNTKNYFSTTSKGLNIKNSNSINTNKESTIVNNNGDNANTSNSNNNTTKGKSKLILNPNHLNQYNCKSFIQHNANSRTGVLTPTTKRNFDKMNTNNSIGKNHHSLQNQSNNIHSEANNKRKNSHSKTKEKFGLSSVLKQIRSTSQHNHNDNNINNSTNNNNLSSNSSTTLKSKQLVKTLTNKNKASSLSTTATGTTVNKRSIIGFAIQKIEHSSVKSPNKKQTLTSPTNNNTSHPKIKEDSERSAITMKSHMHKNSSCSTGNSSIGIIPNNNNTTTNKHNQPQQPIHSSSNFKNISHNNDILIINDK